jgi:putative two-component system response regulator
MRCAGDDECYQTLMDLPDLKQARILVVDDDAFSLANFQRVLNRLGFENVSLLQDSTQFVLNMADFHPDLVLTDLDMPELGGIRVVELVRDMTPPSEIVPVLVVTGHGTLVSKRAALAAGATDFLAKPFDASELFVRVRNLLRIRALQTASQARIQELERALAEKTLALENALAELTKATQ